MITFLDENDVEYGALATIKATNAVNGERSLSGTIVSGDYVLSNIERGWRLRFDDEYYVVTYAKPVDEGRNVQVTFDAVHQFFWDFDKSSVYDQLSDGSHTFVAYLDFIFKDSGYSYIVDSALNVYAFEKQSFGLKKRLTLFNDIITSTGVEFQVNGKVVRILEKVGTDLSTVVRKHFNMNELSIEKNIGDFVTYQKGFGAYFDENDHSKGRLEVEYTSPLASVYGKLEAEPFVDERYTQSSRLLAALKENVDNSYTISVSLDMEDLTCAGYKYTQPIAGDYIMAINETLDFQEKIRIVSFTSEYDVQGTLVKHEVTCNDICTAKKLTASYNTTKRQASTASANATRAYNIANRALVSADGKNTNYYGNSFPQDKPKGTLKTGDLLFLTVGDTVKQYYWNGAEWLINPVVNDVEAFKKQIADELKDVPDREEFEATITEKLATSKAEIKTQIDTAKTQAETNAKTYADEINQATAEVAEQANTAANSLKSDLAKVETDLTATTSTANTTKTNLANYQASNDKLVANLQSNLQTTNGNVSSLKTKIEAVPGQISSAISTVEGKLEAIDQLNLIGAFNLTPQNATFDKTDYTLTSTTTTNTKDGFLQLQFFDANNKNTAFKVADKAGKFAYPFKITKPYVKFRIKINGNVSDAILWCYDKELLKLDTDYVLSGEVLSLSSDGKGNGGKIRYLKIQEGKVATGFSKPPKDVDSYISKVTSEFKQTTDSIKASVSSLDKSTVKSASLTINTDGIVMKAGKSTTDVANAIGSYFAINQNAINLFSDKINVKGSMIVDGAITSTKIVSKSINTAHLNGKIITADVISTGAITANAIKAGAVTTSAMSANSINGDRITAGTLDAAKIKAGSITASQIASGTITSSQIKTGGISAANIAAGAITTDKIAANSINSSKIVSSGITANVIKGGVLHALNNAMEISLNSGQILHYTDNAAIKRVLTNYPTQFIKFATGNVDGKGKAGVTVIGSNRWNSESSDNGGFVGLRAWNGNNIDSVDIVGDRINLASSAYNNADGWVINTIDSSLYMQPRNRSAERNSRIAVGDIWILKGNGTYNSLRDILNTFNGNFSKGGGNVSYTYYPSGF